MASSPEAAPSPSDSIVSSSPPKGVSLSSPPPPPANSSSNHSHGGDRNLSPPSRGGDNNVRHSQAQAQTSGDSGGSASPDSPSDDGGSGKAIAGVVLGAGIMMILVLIICLRRRKKRQDDAFYVDSMKAGNLQYQNHGSSKYRNASYEYPNWHNQQPPGGGGWGVEGSALNSGSGRPVLPPPSPGLALGFNKSTFTYEELVDATGGFVDANLLGQGGFGYVHKGVLPNGKEVAVKSLKSGSGQGEREFQAEVDIISRVHHRYLVSLVGYCIADGQRMLVYEFVPNKTLEHHLHGKNLPVMDFATRMRIAMGSAKGLAYLHEDCHPRIIHRDIKAANILLDFNFDAMVADFGLAKLTSDNHTHVSTRVMGTFGYLAPEYASSGKLTEKSDVFSFGVMLLELITGKRPVDNLSTMEDSLVDWARPLMARSLEDGNFDELVDPRLEGNFNRQEMARMVTCAAASIRHSARKRPKMSQVVRALEGEVSLDDLSKGVKPGHNSVYGSGTSSDYSPSSYETDMKKFRQMALSSQEFTSSGDSSNDSIRDGSLKEHQNRSPSS